MGQILGLDCDKIAFLTSEETEEVSKGVLKLFFKYVLCDSAYLFDFGVYLL
jgi:hypothetical protein